MHDCKRYLSETVNKMVTKSGITYKVFICVDCKKYYIKRFDNIIEVEHNMSIKTTI